MSETVTIDEYYLTSDDNSDGEFDENTLVIDDTNYQDEEPIVISDDHVSDIKSFIFAHDDITIRNALILNEQYIEKLKNLRSNLEQLLKKCQDKYKSNEDYLVIQKYGKKKNTTKIQSISSCGAPFFKTKHFYRVAPPNDDYLYRKNNLKEIFPIDIPLPNSSTWTIIDKSFLIQAVKSQIIDYLSKDMNLKMSSMSRKVNPRGKRKALSDILDERLNLPKKSLADLYNVVRNTSNFTIDWNRIATEVLDGRHTSTECYGIWFMYLMPSIKKGPWTMSEDNTLLEAAKQYNFQNWKAISACIPERSSFQCFVHYRSFFAISQVIKYNKKFTKEEDDLLLESVEKHRNGNTIIWNKVGKYLPNRTRGQLYKRYMFSIKPNISHEKFSIKEDCVLMAAVQEYGLNFSKIAADLFPHRSIVQLRNHYNNTLKVVGKINHWTYEDDIKLMKLAEELGPNWSEISSALETHNRISCRTRYKTIMNFLKKNPKCSIADVPKKNRKLTTNVTKDNWMETIVRIKEDGGMEKKVKKNYYDKLTKQDKNLFDYFKYSFDFKYGEDVKQKHDVTTTITFLNFIFSTNVQKEMLTVERSSDFTMNQRKILNKIYNYKISSLERQSLRIKRVNNFRLPINWNTIVGFRSLTLMCRNADKNKDVNRPDISKSQEAETFKKHFRMLFYWTAVLSKLSSSTIYDTISYEITEFQPSTSVVRNEPFQNYSVITDSGQVNISFISEKVDELFSESKIEKQKSVKRKTDNGSVLKPKPKKVYVNRRQKLN